MNKKIIPLLIIGIILGTASVLIGQIPKPIALWSGLRLFSNHFGYTLVALTVAYFNIQSWKKAFWTSTFIIVVANFIYYTLIEIFGVLGLAEYVVFNVDKLPSIILDFVMWSVIGMIICALSTTAMWYAKHGKTALLRIGVLVCVYLALFLVILEYSGLRLIVNVQNSTASMEQGNVTGYTFVVSNISEDIFQTSLAIVIATVLLVITVKKAKHER